MESHSSKATTSIPSQQENAIVVLLDYGTNKAKTKAKKCFHCIIFQFWYSGMSASCGGQPGELTALSLALILWQGLNRSVTKKFLL